MQQENNDLVYIVWYMRHIDIAGKKFNKLTAVCLDHVKVYRSGSRKQFWKFLCDCGKEVICAKAHVMNGGTMSCKCHKVAVTSKIHRTHGLGQTRFYRIWLGMKSRCTNKNIPIYKHYGEKGIKLKWKSFESFRNDMYESYLKHCAEFGEVQTEIDRIDYNSDYEKKNCRWVGSKIQSRNRCNVKLYSYKGNLLCLAEWAEKLKLPFDSFRSRILRGWGISEAIERPYRGK